MTISRRDFACRIAASAGFAASACASSSASIARAGSKSFSVGINLAGLEFDPSTYPGRLNVNYRAPTQADIQDYARRGIRVFRLPLLWERLQTNAFQRLDEYYCALIDEVIMAADDVNASVILDIHNQAAYKGVHVGNAGVPSRALSNLWSRVSQRYAGRPGLLGYDIMNEPKSVSVAGGWREVAQEVVLAIRQIDQRTTIFIEGQGYSSAGQWLQFNDNLILRDPNNNLVYSAHVYLDRDNSGTHANWLQEVASGITTDIGVERLAVFAGWLKKNNLKGQVGEIGAGSDNLGWLDALSKSLSFCRQEGISVVYWAGGSSWGSTYPYYAGSRTGKPTSQLTVLESFAKS